jgi:hypothetical protein
MGGKGVGGWRVGGDELVVALINVGAIGTLCAARRPRAWQLGLSIGVDRILKVFRLVQDGRISCPCSGC